jgi:repressor LexA
LALVGAGILMASSYTEKQGQYLAFIQNYLTLHGRAPAEAELQAFFKTSAPTVHQMVVKLEEKGFIKRVPGQARSISLIIDTEELPRLRPLK